MITSDLIKNFYKEQFGKYGPEFSYVDHQLLKKDKFEEFFEIQLMRSRKLFIYCVPIAIAYIILGLYYLFGLFSDAFEISNLIFSSFHVLVGGIFLYWVSKQYFIVRSSIWLFKKMLTKTDPVTNRETT